MAKVLALALLTAAAPALAQTGEPYPTYPPAQQQAAPQTTAPQATPQQAPQQGAPQQGGQQQGGTSGTVGGTGGTGGTASSAGGGGASGSSSQQVVVNPPQGAAGGPPASSTTVVNPPANGDVIVTEARERRNPLETVAIDAAYGGLAGLLVGTGVALIDEWDDWDRKLMIGTGVGVIVGAAVGVVHAGYEARQDARARRVASARDGLGSPDRDPVLAGAGTVVGYAGRW
jgi:hypothetical protein